MKTDIIKEVELLGVNFSHISGSEAYFNCLPEGTKVITKRNIEIIKNVPHGYCECGCGNKLPDVWYFDFLSSHNLRGRKNGIPIGMCQCGCGGQTNSSEGRRFIHGHNGKILSNQHSKRIEEISVGDEVFSYNELTGIKEFSKVTKTFKRSVDELLLLKFSNGNEISVTNEHLIFVVSRENEGKKSIVNNWIEAKDLKIGDEFIQLIYKGLGSRLTRFSDRGSSFIERCGEIAYNNLRKADLLNIKKLIASSPLTKNRTRAEISGEKKAKDISKRQSIGIKSAWKNSNSGYHTEQYDKQKLVTFRTKILPKLMIRPTGIEIWMDNILQNNFPNTWRYTGDSSFWIENSNPDFIDEKKKKIIEIYCLYHKKAVYGSEANYMKIKGDLYHRNGWDVLFLDGYAYSDDEVIEKIKQFSYNSNVEIVSLISKEVKYYKSINVYNLELEKNHNFFAFGILVHNCPFHKDSHASFCVSLNAPIWYCHSIMHSGKNGGNIKQLAKLLQNDNLPDFEYDKNEVVYEKQFIAKVSQETFDALSLADESSLLLDRGFDSSTIVNWDIRETTLFTVIPAKVADNNIVGFIIRAKINGWKPKYQYSQGFRKSKFLFGIEKFEEQDCVILVEGCFPAKTKIICENKNRKIGSTGGAGHLLVNRNIEDISIGDKILSFNENTHEKELKLVTRVFSRVSRDLITLKFSNGNKLVCTPEHPIATNANGKIIWIPASELLEGSECIQYKYDGLNRRLNCFELAKSRANKSFTEIFGTEKAKEMCEKNSKANIGRKPWNNGTTFSDYFPKEAAKEISEKWSEYRKGNKNSIGPRSDNTKNKNSLASKKMWKNPDIANKILVSQRKDPNNTEIFIKKFLEKEFPNKFEIDTNGEVVKKYKLDTDGLSPDFIWADGKKAILFNGCSWHCCKECKKHSPRKISDNIVWKRDEEVVERLNGKGWQILVIWHHDLIDLEELHKKVADFIYNPNSEVVYLTSKIYEHNYGKKVYNLEVSGNNNYFVFGMLVHNCLDTIKMFQNGFPNTLAILGSELSNDQIRIIGKLGGKIFIFLDSDVSGIEATKKIAKQLSGFEVSIPDYGIYTSGDPADKNIDETKAILANKVSFLKTLFISK